MPFLDRHPGRHEHVPEFVDPVVRESRLVVVVPDLDTDNTAVGKIVVVTDNGFEKVQWPAAGSVDTTIKS